MLATVIISDGLWTYDKAESSSPLGVNEEQSGNSGDDLNGTISKRSVQGLDGRVASVSENGGAVERND